MRDFTIVIRRTYFAAASAAFRSSDVPCASARSSLATRCPPDLDTLMRPAGGGAGVGPKGAGAHEVASRPGGEASSVFSSKKVRRRVASTLAQTCVREST